MGLPPSVSKQSTFGWPSGAGASICLRPEELQLLLHGIEGTTPAPLVPDIEIFFSHPPFFAGLHEMFLSL